MKGPPQDPAKVSSRVSWLVALSLVAAMLALVMVGWLGARQLDRLEAGLQTLFEDRVVAADQLRRVHRALGDQTTALLAGLDAPPAAGAEPPSLRIARQASLLHDEAQRQWQAYERTLLVEPEQRLLPGTRDALEAAWRELATALLRLAEPVPADLRRSLLQRVDRLRRDALERVDALQAVQVEAAEAVLRASREERQALWLRLAALLAAALALAGVALALAWRAHHQRLQRWQARQQRQNQFYAALSAVNHLLVRVQDVGQLYAEVCRICVETGHASIAALVERQGAEAQLVQAHGHGAEIYQLMETRWRLDDPQAPPRAANEVLASGRRRVDNDLLQLAPQLDAAQRRALQLSGMRARCCLPVRRDDAVVAALLLHSNEPGFFDDEVCRLLDELAADLSFALQVLQTRERARRAQEQAQQAESLFRRLVRLLPLSVYVVDIESGRVLELNDAACRLHGRSRDEAIGRTLDEIGNRIAAADQQRYVQAVMAQGQAAGIEASGVDASGRAFQVLLYGARLNYLGRDARLTCSVDITALTAAKRRVQDLAAEEAAASARAQYVAKLSHELKTPLNAVLGFSQLLAGRARERGMPDEQAWIERIQSAGLYLLALVGDVLDMSRPGQSGIRVQLEPVALAPALEAAVALSRLAAEARGITLQIDPLPAEARCQAVRADARRLQQVLVNLLSNAVKYNRDGGWVRVAVSCDGEGPQRRLRTAITDGGIGMSEEQLGQLFQPYNRLGRDASDAEGTGLGLVLTRELVEHMQGRLEVQSRNGLGTTVTVDLPACEPAAAAAAAAEQPVAAAPGGAPRAPVAGRVLYVEDNPVNTLLVQQALAAYPGVQLLTAETGADGLELARRDRPDLVLLDMNLPDLSGLEVLERLKADPQTCALPVVALSAADEGADVERARRAGVADYWAKPIVLESFLAGVARQLAG